MYGFMNFYNELEVLKNNRENKLYTDNTVNYIKQLKQGWYEFDKPTFEEYMDYYDDDISIKDYEYDFPFDKYYILIQITNDCVIINNKLIYTPFSNNEYEEDWSNCFKYLLTAKPTTAIPIQLHYGIINRKQLYDLIPEYRTSYLSNANFKKEDLLNYINNQDITEVQMTLKDYLQACYYCYQANDLEINFDNGNIIDNLIASYNKNADGRDDCLLNLDMNDPLAFDIWYIQSHYGHPFEIMRGGNSTHISLYPIKNKETGLYYYQLNGKSQSRSMETLNAYVALRQKSIPVKLGDEEVLINRYTENDYVGILPYYVNYSYYNTEFEELFNIKVSDTVHWYNIEEYLDLQTALNFINIKRE